MDELLNNPVYYSLTSGDARLGSGTEKVKFFDEEVSPFAGFEEQNKNGFDELRELLPPGRKILYATRHIINEPAGWKLKHHIPGVQFVFTGNKVPNENLFIPVPLQNQHTGEMIGLASLTKPGPFSKRTIEFGNYYGIFDNNVLVAMTGQRLHVHNYTEVSAVCTHPDHTGKGYAAALLLHQLAVICNSGQIPFLHVRTDNERAIALYERLGFVKNGEMHFYFLKKIN